MGNNTLKPGPTGIALSAALAVAIALGAPSPAQAGDGAEAARERVDAFFEALAAEDRETALAQLTPEAMLHAPYNPNGDATDEGVRSFPAALYVAGAMATYDNLVFEDRSYSMADDSRTVWLEAEGRLRVAETGSPYENRYVFKFELDGGKIAAITEYTNVVTLARDGVTAR
ncbi:MAG: nuclear transport factor 2 family protein [Pseudomonadota bacterium]